MSEASGSGPRPAPESKSGRTRERILDAAALVLSRKGYGATRLGDVAEAAELQAPAIYYYFASREDLIEEVMWVGIAHMREHLVEVLAALPPETSPLDRIVAAVEAHLTYSLTISDYTTASIRNAGQLPDSIRTRQLEEEARYGVVWRQLFRDAQDAGQLRSDVDVTVTRMLVMGAINWAVEWWTPRSGTISELVAEAQRLVRAGIASPEAGGSRPVSRRSASARRS